MLAEGTNASVVDVVAVKVTATKAAKVELVNFILLFLFWYCSNCWQLESAFGSFKRRVSNAFLRDDNGLLALLDVAKEQDHLGLRFSLIDTRDDEIRSFLPGKRTRFGGSRGTKK